ncbi:MAG: Mov34/MPN/PAD-1 family protein [Elainellaceae cyanobacterium]
MLRLTLDHINAIARTGEAAYPEEGCGILLGRSESDAVRQLVEVRPVPNAWSAVENITDSHSETAEPRTKTSRYTIDPKDMLKAQRDARDLDLDIIGIIHSHPNHPAFPSECDRAVAWSHYSYIIVSVQRGAAQDVLCWRLDEQRQFQPEGLLITP